MALAIQKRKQVQEQLSLIMKSIKVAEDEVKILQDENNLRLTEMITILERNKSTSKLFPEDDTPEIIKQKMARSAQLYEQMLKEATDVAAEYDLRQKIKISVSLHNEHQQPIPTCQWLEKGFSFDPVISSVASMGPLFRRDLLLISHAVFSFLRWQNINLKSVQQQQPTSHASNSSTNTNRPARSLSPASKFVLDQSSIFILKLFQSGTPKGEIHIRPLPTFHPIFLQKLGEFCYKSPKNFCRSVEKVHI